MIESARKIWHVLNGSEQRNIFFLGCFMMISTLLETLSIGLLYPLISSLLGQDVIKSFAFLPQFFSINSGDNLILFISLTFIIFFVIKILYSIFFNYYQSRVLAQIHNSLVDRLFGIYLNREYLFHISNNSALLFRNITFEINQFLSALASLLVLVAELLQLIGIIALILIVEPIGGAITYFFIIFSGYLFMRYTKLKVQSLGVSRQSKDGERLIYIQETLAAIKEVILMQKQRHFSEKIARVSKGLSIISTQERFIQNLPKIWVELVTLLAGLILALLIFYSSNADNMLPILGLFAAASFRAMPSVNKILTNYHNFNYSIPSINVIQNDFLINHSPLKLAPVKSNTDFTSIKLDRLSHSYSGGKFQTLEDVTFTVNRGDIIGIIGESGAGKSTLVNLFLGLLQPTSGGVYVDGSNIHDSLEAWQSRLSYVPQQINLIDDSIAKNVAFGLSESEINYKKVSMALEIAQLSQYVDKLPEGYNSNVGQNGISMSGGQRQRLGIARAVYFDAQIMVLDEATSSLDANTEKEFMNAINGIKGDLTILIIAHRSSALTNANRIFKINDRKITEVTLSEMIKGGV